MVVRLGFAVATALEPDILITDEVLAVGDESFQKKCIAWMERYLAGRRHAAAVLAQHVPHPEALPPRAVAAEAASSATATPRDVTQAYLAYHEEKSAGAKQPIPQAAATAAGVYAMQSLDARARRTRRAGRATLTVRGEVYSPDGRAPVVLVGIVRADGTPVYGVATDMDGVRRGALAPDRYAFALDFPVPAAAARQVLRPRARARPRRRAPVRQRRAPIVVTGETREFGLVRLAHRWDNDA